MKLRFSLLMVLAACSNDPLPNDEAFDPQPPGTVAGRPSPPPPPADETPPDEPATPARPVNGTLLVTGKIDVVGVTDDGWVAYFRTPAGGSNVDRTFEVFDTKTKKRVSLGPAGSVNDTAMVRGKVVALWKNLRAPFGWAGLTVWTAASGITTAKDAKSLPGFLATNDDASRLAFSFGLPPNQAGITQLATSAPTAIATPQIIAQNVGIGDGTTKCIPSIGFHADRLFASSCEGSATTGTVRMIDASGAVTTVRTNARPAWSSTPTGDRILVTSGAGEAELHAMPSNDVVPVATNVSSAVLTPDGATVVYATNENTLHRASVANPTVKTTLLASGAREILGVSPAGTHAVVASLPPDPASESTHRTDLHLVSLDAASAPATATPLVTTATGMIWSFTRSGSHVITITDLTGIGLDGMKLRARPVAGGPEIVLGGRVRRLVQSTTSTKITYVEVDAKYRESVKVVDLEKGTAPVVFIDDVESATAQDDIAYVGVGEQGLYAIALP